MLLYALSPVCNASARGDTVCTLANISILSTAAATTAIAMTACCMLQSVLLVRREPDLAKVVCANQRLYTHCLTNKLSHVSSTLNPILTVV
jgi:hypothetical protein